MEKRLWFLSICLMIIIILLFVINYSWLDKITGEAVGSSEIPGGEFEKFRRDMPTEVNSNINEAKTFTIANWNMDVFGKKKANDQELMNLYASIISNYDIIFLQEIRDNSGESFKRLCSLLVSYDCNISSRAGRSTNKEQVGIIYRKGIKIINFTDFNPDVLDRWERPPIEVRFNVDGYKLSVYNIHTKPTNASIELTNLDSLVPDYGDTIVIGDLNADCGYFNHGKEDQFNKWNWIISDSDDTSTSESSCAYDRIIINDNAKNEFEYYGIFNKSIDKNVSDHYLVWAEFKIKNNS